MTTPIANCKVEFAFKCPKLWSKMKETEDQDVRHCDVCDRNVHLCNTMEDVHFHASKGDCIAVPSQRRERMHYAGIPMRI